MGSTCWGRWKSSSRDPNPKRACDTPYCTVALEPVLLLWQRTADKRLGQFFAAWMDTWVEATARAEHGKPAGVVPAAIRWPDGAVRGPGENWWDQPRPMQAEFYLLAPGSYRLTLFDAAGKLVQGPQAFPVAGPRTRISLELPAAELCTLKVLRASAGTE